MAENTLGICSVCGALASLHVTEIRNGKKSNQSFCPNHAPPEWRDKLPLGPHRTPADEVAFLRKQLDAIDQVSDPASRDEFKAEIEKLIVDIEAGRKRMGDIT